MSKRLTVALLAAFLMPAIDVAFEPVRTDPRFLAPTADYGARAKTTRL